MINSLYEKDKNTPILNASNSYCEGQKYSINELDASFSFWFSSSGG